MYYLGHHVTVHVARLLPVGVQEIPLGSQVTPGKVQAVSWIIVVENMVAFVQKSGEDSLLLGLFVSVVGRYRLEVQPTLAKVTPASIKSIDQ